MCVPGRNLPCLYGFRSTVKSRKSVADAAVVEQRVALAGSAVADDRLAGALGRDQQLQQLALGLAHLLLERACRSPMSR